MDGARAAEILRQQADHVRGRSPLYERLLAGLAGATERGFDGGVIPRLLERSDRTLQESRLLILAALHHAALRDPSLPHAAWFPTAVEDARPPDEGAPGALALAYLVEHETTVTDFLHRNRLQTNEIGRCVGLLPGVLEAAAFGQPLRLLEVGASAGLNLRLDRYRYHYRGGPTWGPVGGPELETAAEGAVPTTLVPPSIEIAQRRGVDLHPIDPTSEEGARLLTSFVWPDEHDRHQRLGEAIDVARATPAELDAGDLADWTERHARPEDGVTTVLFHSIVAYMLDDATADRFGEAVERALREATGDAPFAYLKLEEPQGVASPPELTLATGDGTGPPQRRTVLTCDWHGRWVDWW